MYGQMRGLDRTKLRPGCVGENTAQPPSRVAVSIVSQTLASLSSLDRNIRLVPVRQARRKGRAISQIAPTVCGVQQQRPIPACACSLNAIIRSAAVTHWTRTRTQQKR